MRGWLYPILSTPGVFCYVPRAYFPACRSISAIVCMALFSDVLFLSCTMDRFIRFFPTSSMSFTTVLQYQQTSSLPVNSYSSSIMFKQSAHVQPSHLSHHLVVHTSMINHTYGTYPIIRLIVLIQVSICTYYTNISTFRHLTSICIILSSPICGS